ncbi:uncharacterized protein LOC107267136 [Cephus cinctus]|uniref:Uncharacterized protein LOC107267136 n=1 Tax=Cephus cinctus TaxID=211228 RepID=A0AAJ7RFY7_CEPCN|nr:uncharacterized protein LOC107267136 [Cephus cinctus]
MNNICWCLLISTYNIALSAQYKELGDLPNFYIPTDAPLAGRNENILNCQDISETTVNGKHVCRGQIILKDNFNFINTDIWKYDVRIPTEPDYEFVTYVKLNQTAYVNDGILHLKPTLLKNVGENGKGNLHLEGCTASIHGGECSRNSMSFQVLPPVLAARIRTRESISFRYGEVKIRAKMPKGDWIYPIIWLEPKDSEYGLWYISGRIIIAFSRGNEKLGNNQSLNYGQMALYRGCMYWPDNLGIFTQPFIPYIHRGTVWSDDFHTYSMKWTPDELTFKVDGKGKSSCRPPNKVLYGRETIWSKGGNIAPFDKEDFICYRKTTMITWVLTVYCLLGTALCKICVRESVTVASGTRAPQGPYCSGDLIFADEFDVLDFKTWQHEITAAGGGNWEFNYYHNNRSNSYTVDGSLWIRPTLTSDTYGEAFLTSGTLNLNNGAPADQCTNALFYGCERTGTPNNVINPIQSARLRTVNSFSFKYGTVHVRAKMPTGDWLWPAIWMLPRDNAYGTWPASGEIDITENRGNTQLYENGVNIGVEQTGGTLHFGPHADLNGYENAHYLKNSPSGQGYNLDYHVYKVIWTPDSITFLVDDELIGTVTPNTNFWDLGQFETREPGTENPWRYGTKMAPFDQEFYIILNLAVGGTNFFPDGATNPNAKPWLNKSPTAATDFWNARSNWLPTWNLSDNTTASLAVDYVRVWAL